MRHDTICEHRQPKGRWQWCSKHSAYTNSSLCIICRDQGHKYIANLFARRDGEITEKVPAKRTMGQRGLRAVSEVIGRLGGGPKITDEEVKKRAVICQNCELLIQENGGDWCGELIRLRFGEESKRRKGCGCLLDVKRLYENFHCPRALW